ncbi:hypothetical protein ECZU20_38050 [Escherichia coli]|nr:hypothetical protein ECZU20_38050 [Escherichia coli]
MQQDQPGILTTGKLRGDIRKLCGQGSHGRFILPDGNPCFLCSQRLVAQPLLNDSCGFSGVSIQT